MGGQDCDGPWVQQAPIGSRPIRSASSHTISRRTMTDRSIARTEGQSGYGSGHHPPAPTGVMERPRQAGRSCSQSGSLSARHNAGCEHCARLQRLRAAAGDNVPGAEIGSRGPVWRGPGRRPGREHSPGCSKRRPLHGRRVPEGLGEAPGTRESALRRNVVRRLMREHDLQAPHRVKPGDTARLGT